MTAPRTARKDTLTGDQIAAAVRYYEQGEPLASIAAKFAVSASAVSYHAAKRTVLRRDRPIIHGTRRGYQQHKRRGPQA